MKHGSSPLKTCKKCFIQHDIKFSLFKLCSFSFKMESARLNHSIDTFSSKKRAGHFKFIYFTMLFDKAYQKYHNLKVAVTPYFIH